MIEIYLLEALDAFMRCGTLSKAAEELHISQPALSRSMKKLEESLDVPLFIRTGNSIELNETGKFAAGLAGSLLNQNRNMIEQVRNHAASLHTISIGYCAPGPAMELPGLLTGMYPDLKISSEQKSEEELLKGLKENRYTYIILSHETHDDTLSEVYYGSETLYIAAIPAHPLSVYKDQGVCFSDINGETFLQVSDVGIWDDIKKKMMPDSRILKQESLDSLSQIINASSILSFATDISIRLFRAAENPERIFIPIRDPEATVNYYCVCRKENAGSLLMKRLAAGKR